MLVDLEDPAFLSTLNSVELALVSNIAARLQVVARQKTEDKAPSPCWSTSSCSPTRQ